MRKRSQPYSRLWVAPVLALAVLVAACGGSGAPAATQPSAPAAAPGQQPAAQASAPKWPTTAAEIALYKGADRQQMLEAGAKKEGKVSFYAVFNIDELKFLAEGFKKKYPFLEVEFTRVDGSDITTKVLQEHQAKQPKSDIIMTNVMKPLVDAGAMAQFHSPELAAYPSWAVDEKGFKAARARYNYGLVVNEKLVPADKMPKTYEDLLDPWWQGKILVEGPFDTKFPVGVIHAMGEEKAWKYLEAIAKQGVITKGSSARINKVLAGENPAALGVFIYTAEGLIAEKNAPLKTVILNPTITSLNWAGLTKGGAHPHSAMLLMDYIFSLEGMNHMATRGGSDLLTRPGTQYGVPYMKAFNERMEKAKVVAILEEWLDASPAVEARLRKLHGLE